jgi:type II secretory pathway component PulJ
MKTRRRGFSLVELLLVISSLTVLLGICVGLIHSLLRLDRIARTNLAESATIGRLARQFRQDVHAAERIDEPVRNESLRLELPARRTIEYASRSGQLTRTLRRSGEDEGREVYHLAARGTPRFESIRRKGQAILTMIFEGKKGGPRSPFRREIRIDATLGRDERLAGTSKEATP